MNNAGSTKPANWPPKSPYEAILSSPRGRQKLRAQESVLRGPTSPSRRVERHSERALQQRIPSSASSEDDEDEETLQLRLQAIEAKLKLKRLRNKKSESQDALAADAYEGAFSLANRDIDPSLVGHSQQQNRSHKLPQASQLSGVQVPLSPTETTKSRAEQSQRSPRRVLLGIDKGLGGRHVSLRRVASHRQSSNKVADPFVDSGSGQVRQDGSYFGRNNPVNHTRNTEPFSQKVAEARAKDRKTREQRNLLAKKRAFRSSAFETSAEELKTFEDTADNSQTPGDNRSEQRQRQTFSRDEVVRSMQESDRGSAERTSSTTGQISFRVQQQRKGLEHKHQYSTEPNSIDSMQLGPEPVNSAGKLGDDTEVPLSEDLSLFESYSKTNLSRRVLPHTFMQRTLEGKTPVMIPELLKRIKAPDFLIPDELIETDFVLFGIVASKSSSFDHKQVRAKSESEVITSGTEAERSRNNENGKYLVITLTDLKWALDLFLFGPAFVRFRKLTPGTLVAILNPDIMPPPKHLSDTGKWSLKLGTGNETVLEIGVAKDLKWCKSVKKDGQPCNAWIDRRHTEFCEFHMNLGVERTRSGRMEVQGMSSLFGPGGKHGSHASRSGVGQKRNRGPAANARDTRNISENGSKFDRSAQTTYFVAPSPDLEYTAANLIDAEDFMIRGGSQARQREALAAREKELVIAKSLGLRGNGTGADYLRSRKATPNEGYTATNTSNAPSQLSERGAKVLGIITNKSSNVHLSPLKRKRSTAGSHALTSPKKKTRFITAKGIREAGRDSLNISETESKERGHLNDEDDLDIV